MVGDRVERITVSARAHSLHPFLILDLLLSFLAVRFFLFCLSCQGHNSGGADFTSSRYS